MRRVSIALGMAAGIAGALVAGSRLASAQAPSTWGAASSGEAADAGPSSASPEDAVDAAAGPTADAAPAVTEPAAAAAPPTATELADAGAAPDAASAAYVPKDTGFNLGLRASFAVPFGLAKSDPSHTLLSDEIAHAIPIGVDVGYFFDPHLYLGGYLLYGFATNAGGANANAACNDPSLTCSANTWRVGASARWHFRPESQIDPWAGLALGYNVVNLEADDSSGSPQLSASLHGFEMSVLAGADFKPRSFFGLGPFVELSMGHYANDSANAVYGYFAIGARLRTGL